MRIAVERRNGQAQLQLELSQIDLEWERDRHRYMGHNLYGKAFPPKKAAGMVFAVVAATIGIALGLLLIWGIDPVKHPEGPVIAILLAGLIFVAGVGGGLWEYHKAEAYEDAQAAYLKKKEAARLKYEGRGEGQK